MIDFNNGIFCKLEDAPNDTFDSVIGPQMLPEEEIIIAFKAKRDGVVFTDKRIFAINIKDRYGFGSVATLPYSRIQAFQTETSSMGAWVLELYFSSMGALGKVHFEFEHSSKINLLGKIISARIL